MKNKLIFTSIFYIIGIVLAYSETIAVSTLIISGIIAIVALYISFDKISNLIYYIIIICLSIIIGFLFTKNNLNNQVQNYYNKLIQVEGKVTEKNLTSDTIIVEINNIYYEGKETGKLKEKLIINLEDKTNINIGSVISIESRLLEPISSTNRYIFDYNKYLKRKKITGNMFSNTANIKIIKEEGLVYKLRKSLVNRISEFITVSTNDRNGMILKSVVFGDNEYLDDDFLKDIRKTGIAHIFAVSGLHIGILIVVFTFIFKFLRFPLPKCSSICSPR